MSRLGINSGNEYLMKSGRPVSSSHGCGRCFFIKLVVLIQIQHFEVGILSRSSLFLRHIPSVAPRVIPSLGSRKGACLTSICRMLMQFWQSMVAECQSRYIRIRESLDEKLAVRKTRKGAQGKAKGARPAQTRVVIGQAHR